MDWVFFSKFLKLCHTLYFFDYTYPSHSTLKLSEIALESHLSHIDTALKLHLNGNKSYHFKIAFSVNQGLETLYTLEKLAKLKDSQLVSVP